MHVRSAAQRVHLWYGAACAMHTSAPSASHQMVYVLSARGQDVTSVGNISLRVPATGAVALCVRITGHESARQLYVSCAVENRQRAGRYETMEEFHLGMDDIDSPRGGCTTHFASLLAEDLTNLGVTWLDYPNLIRLNPNVPYRTRGNGAVVLRFRAPPDVGNTVLENVEQAIEKYVEHDYPNTNPGVVLVRGRPPSEMSKLSALAEWRVLAIDVVRRFLSRHHIAHISRGNGRGIVGATAAVGNRLLDDCTFEFIAYRSLEDTAHERGVDVESVYEMNRRMKGKTFSNIDPQTGSVLIQPHGPDPVIYGIRGDSPSDLVEAASLVRCHQTIERWTIFRTNQGTGEHLRHLVRISDLRPYMAAVVRGRVERRGIMTEGGHLIFTISDDAGTIDCAVYEPTGEFREVAASLIPGDIIEVHAGVRPASRTHGMTLNVEGLNVVALVENVILSNPLCPQCGKRMKSAGREKGFKCTKCGYRDASLEKVREVVPRHIHPRLYLPPPRAQRHLTRPYERLGVRNVLENTVPTLTWLSSHGKT